MNDYFMKNAPIRFVFPINGDCVNGRDGRLCDDGLVIPCTVKAAPDAEVYINGERASYSDGVYRAEVKLIGYRNTVVAEDRTNGTGCKIAVYHLADATRKYRVSSDDNILFLQDITEKKDIYRSIFENPYLAVYKKAHELYGAKVHLNLFYESNDDTMRYFNIKRPYFNLSMMTDKFRDEFRANSDWLKLSFHAYAEFPNKPYQLASGKKIAEDCIKVCREIVRFAGEDSISDALTVHWGEANRECVRALRALGIRALTGYFEKNPDGTPLVAYYTDGELTDHIGERDFFVDTAEDMVFGRIDLVMNLNTYRWVQDSIREIAAHPHKGGFVSVMIHEQYFHEDYAGYLPDFEARVLDTCKFLYEKGYTGAHITETVTEPPHRVHMMFSNR